MNTFTEQINTYLTYCKTQKQLDAKTLKAYRIDLRQLSEHLPPKLPPTGITSAMLESYIAVLHQKYKPKTSKRKIASAKAFFHYLEYREIIERNPFNKLQIKFREPFILPKTIPLQTLETFLTAVYRQHSNARTVYQQKSALRDIAVFELLFATGMRISELCSLGLNDVNLCDRAVLIYGKGKKERKIQIGNEDVIDRLIHYKKEYLPEMEISGCFFVNRSGRKLSEQSVRRMIQKYSALASIDLHITPHMFRHTFATSLLEADVDIRYIQEMLGHSSINITEIYTHVAMAKQRDILTAKHPRNNFRI